MSEHVSSISSSHTATAAPRQRLRHAKRPALRLLTALILLGGPAAAWPATAQALAPVPDSSFNGCPLLAQGSSGPCVVELQQDLNAIGTTPALTEDGSFGPMTRQAVVSVQSQYNQDQDGVVGPATAQILIDGASVRTPSPVLAPSSFNPAKASSWAIMNAKVVSAGWRSPRGDHCTEFVSAALMAAGLPSDSTWWPFWEASQRAPLTQQLKDAVKLAVGQVLPSSPAWASSFSFADYFTSKDLGHPHRDRPARPGFSVPGWRQSG